MRPEHTDPERCSKCQGICCKIYSDALDGGMKPTTTWFEEWCEAWDETFKDSGADSITPLHNPLVTHMTGNEHMRAELLKQGIDIDYCKYRGKNGCILPWELRPKACREFRCFEWIGEEKR